MEANKPVIGKYILDSLSIGMYNDPLMLIREYIQNAADAIDNYKELSSQKEYKGRIEIRIDGRTRELTVKDNGSGVPAKSAWHVLHDLGNSSKKLNKNRGFRGIGRLGGIGYCDNLVFTTKYDGEAEVTVSVWNCNKLRQLIRSSDLYDTEGLLAEIVSYKKEKYEGNKKDHFFAVQMKGLEGSREVLLNVPLIKAYVSEVAPVPFNGDTFSFGDRIDQEIRKRIPNYQTYYISINGEPIFKPYSDKLMLRGGHKDLVNGIDYIELGAGKGPLAFGWIAKTNLMGTLSAQSHIDGIRVRKDNILIGDRNIVSGLFREGRFNNYLAGELHVINGNLIPNSRRDDFEDNADKEDFYETFIKNIGLPISKQIRQISLERNKTNSDHKGQKAIEQARAICKNGYFAAGHKKDIISGLKRYKLLEQSRTEELDELIEKVMKARHHLDVIATNIRSRNKEFLKTICESIYIEHEDKARAVHIVSEILARWQRESRKKIRWTKGRQQKGGKTGMT